MAEAVTTMKRLLMEQAELVGYLYTCRMRTSRDTWLRSYAIIEGLIA